MGIFDEGCMGMFNAIIPDIEGLLNNMDRPPAKAPKSNRVLFAGEAIPHFNEVDECAGLDGLVTYRLWRELGFERIGTS
jgi:hypothetical protein